MVLPVPGTRLTQQGSLMYILHFLLILQAPGPQCNSPVPVMVPCGSDSQPSSGFQQDLLDHGCNSGLGGCLTSFGIVPF